MLDLGLQHVHAGVLLQRLGLTGRRRVQFR